MDMSMNNSMGTAMHWVNLNAVAPAITVQPTGGEYDGETPITLTVTATGTAPLTYQWQSSPAGAGTWSNIEGATASTYEAAPEEDTDYRVVVSNAADSVNSDAAEVTVAAAIFSDDFSGDLSKWDEVDPGSIAAIASGVYIATTGTAECSLWAKAAEPSGQMPTGESVFEIAFKTPAAAYQVAVAVWCNDTARGYNIEDSFSDNSRRGYYMRVRGSVLPVCRTLQGSTVGTGDQVGTGVANADSVVVRATIFANGDRRIEWIRNGSTTRTVDIASGSLQAGIGNNWAVGMYRFGADGSIDDVVAQRIS